MLPKVFIFPFAALPPSTLSLDDLPSPAPSSYLPPPPPPPSPSQPPQQRTPPCWASGPRGVARVNWTCGRGEERRGGERANGAACRESVPLQEDAAAADWGAQVVSPPVCRCGGARGVLVDPLAGQRSGGCGAGGAEWSRGSCRRQMMEKWIELDPGVTESAATGGASSSSLPPFLLPPSPSPFEATD